MFAIVAAFGLMVATAEILPIIQQAYAVAARRVPQPCSEFQSCQEFGQSHARARPQP
jgi:hypothetical protein